MLPALLAELFPLPQTFIQARTIQQHILRPSLNLFRVERLSAHRIVRIEYTKTLSGSTHTRSFEIGLPSVTEADFQDCLGVGCHHGDQEIRPVLLDLGLLR